MSACDPLTGKSPSAAEAQLADAEQAERELTPLEQALDGPACLSCKGEGVLRARSAMFDQTAECGRCDGTGAEP